MAELIYQGTDPSIARHNKFHKQMNLKLCIQNNKRDLDISGVGEDDGFIAAMTEALGTIFKFDYREYIKDKDVSSQEDLAIMRANFDKIKTCLQDRSNNDSPASKIVDKCEIFVENGQVSDYKTCLIGTQSEAWNVEL
jgi:hypothetical protein